LRFVKLVILAERRAYECDALTAYRCPPLAVTANNHEEVGHPAHLP
jgi:hypothetical protein